MKSLKSFRAILILCSASLAACSIQPIKPWERGNLSRSVMLKNSGAQHAALEDHTYSSKESNSGSSGLGGGGCGCN